MSYNPGLHARNRYGFSIYKHVQHWLTLGIDLIYNYLKWLDNQRVWNYLIRYFSGKKNGWQDYGSELHFIPCTRPGHQACLDQYETDGNIQFHWNELILIQKRKHFGSNISILTILKAALERPLFSIDSLFYVSLGSLNWANLYSKIW